MHGAERLLYREPLEGYQIDIFLDRFKKSHKLDSGKPLETEPITLPAAELLLTKLQIAEMNGKDVGDVLMLLGPAGRRRRAWGADIEHVAGVCAVTGGCTRR